ncbi:hypothetical protein AVL59_07715 [Streptomyces griseochromogenes]|uniref:Uncharacterized protein n=1 Tax=Streptomyces griseochromogenes TaxID=68214 RepID=A0A1B1ASG8_9ACTN|nr:hypothetical protein AVL59_07715 [Streptomyces griseochromogenes]
MGYEFTVRENDDEWVWAPGAMTGGLFMGAATALGSVLNMPTGLREVPFNWVKIDPGPYAAFVDTALEMRCERPHGELGSLLGGVVPLMIMLADNAGVRLTVDTEEKHSYVEWVRIQPFGERGRRKT